MPRRIGSDRAGRRSRTYLKQWRVYRGLTLERAAERFDMSGAQLSRVENGKSPYTQDFLELAAEAYLTDVASLLMRNPEAPEALWSIWDHAKPGERRMIEDLARTVVKTGTK